MVHRTSDSPPVMGATRLIVLLAGISKILKPAAARPGDTAPPPELYGLVRVHDLPSLPALVKVNVSSGQLKFVGGGGGLNTTAGTGDLVAIHQRSRRYYYLGGGGRAAAGGGVAGHGPRAVWCQPALVAGD
jgi:hypothetical protein